MTAASLVGCAGVAPEPAAEPTGAAPVESEPSAAFLQPGWRFSENASQTYQEALAKIDKNLAEDDNALRYAGEICHGIRQGRSDAQVVEHAARQFEVEASVAMAIVEATKSTVCAK
ncbi:hypothetical protein [Jidongwangia harbinensis]|uniref:hypothetical protein n=1 Tax=Jidongwangia harbinensis TaxID=2878561 RepID=UPI001CDA130F|nr:hypothetical protein [Jidongwangia harbinensis]MCA2211692.1 hypothetical protein [Jidongwangia harbinensis]